MSPTLSYEEEAERAINPLKLANMEPSRDCNSSQMTEMTVQQSLRDESHQKTQTSQHVCLCVCV